MSRDTSPFHVPCQRSWLLRLPNNAGTCTSNSLFSRPHKHRACHTTMQPLGLFTVHGLRKRCSQVSANTWWPLQNQLFKEGIKRLLLGKQNRIFLQQASTPPTASELAACALFIFNFSRTTEWSVRHLGWDLKGFHALWNLQSGLAAPPRNSSKDE